MGLLKTAATVAVASSVHGRIQRRQQARWAAQNQAPADVPTPPPPAQYAAPAQQAYTEPVPPQAPAAPPPQAPAAPPPQAPAAPAPPADMSDRLAQLKQLGELLSAGVLTQAEFEQQKARILNG
jgi:hypothetical protein